MPLGCCPFFHQAVEDAFRVCGELWGGEAGLASPASDATPTDGGDAFLAPSTNTGTDSSGSDTFSETWEDESGGEFADVSEWTQKQVSRLGGTNTVKQVDTCQEMKFPAKQVVLVNELNFRRMKRVYIG